MEVDHGTVQPMEIVYGDITAKPFIPIFINSVAPPFTPVKRVRELGEAIGRHLATWDEKVLLISSGGLSHDPPVPRLATATPAQRAMLMGENQPLPADARAPRQQRVIDAARDFAAGTADIQDLAPEWDRELLRILASGDLTPVDAWDPDEMTRIAGNSSHEVRTWIAGYAAMAATGSYAVQHSYYRPDPRAHRRVRHDHRRPHLSRGPPTADLLRTPSVGRAAGAGASTHTVSVVENEGVNVVEPPVRRTGQRLGTVVLDELKERLLSGQYAAGSRISIEEVKAEFGVSKQPVMDAMRRLEAIGIVQIVPQSGCRVARYTSQEILDFFNLFGSFEGEIAAAAASSTHRRTARSSSTPRGSASPTSSTAPTPPPAPAGTGSSTASSTWSSTTWRTPASWPSSANACGT